MAKKAGKKVEEKQVAEEQVMSERTKATEAVKGVLPAFIENIAQGMVNGKVPIALIAVFDQEGTVSHTKFLHRDGNTAAIAGELQLIGLEVLLSRQKNITA